MRCPSCCGEGIIEIDYGGHTTVIRNTCKNCKGKGSVKEKKKVKLSPRDSRLKRLYGLEPGEYEKIFDFQGRVCYICKNPPKENKRLHVDHDHKSGLTRGLLCWVDNGALGKFRDNALKLRYALDYINNPPATTALGREVFGRTGRITNKRKRRKKKRK